MFSLERHNPHQWGYAGMTTAMKRSAYNDDDNENHSNHVTKITKSSPFVPPTFHKRESIQSEEPSRQSFAPSPSAQPPGLLNDALISRLLNNSRPEPM
jgi:hypothetical protein